MLLLFNYFKSIFKKALKSVTTKQVHTNGCFRWERDLMVENSLMYSGLSD